MESTPEYKEATAADIEEMGQAPFVDITVPGTGGGATPTPTPSAAPVPPPVTSLPSGGTTSGGGFQQGGSSPILGVTPTATPPTEGVKQVEIKTRENAQTIKFVKGYEDKTFRPENFSKGL